MLQAFCNLNVSFNAAEQLRDMNTVISHFSNHLVKQVSLLHQLLKKNDQDIRFGSSHGPGCVPCWWRDGFSCCHSYRQSLTVFSEYWYKVKLPKDCTWSIVRWRSVALVYWKHLKRELEGREREWRENRPCNKSSQFLVEGKSVAWQCTIMYH